MRSTSTFLCMFQHNCYSSHEKMDMHIVCSIILQHKKSMPSQMNTIMHMHTLKNMLT